MPSSRSTCLVLLVLVLLPAFAARAQTGPGVAAQLDAYMTAAVHDDDFSGAVLVVRGEQQLLRKGYGLANRELDVPNTAETVFRIGTTTQRFTNVATMLLRDRGLLALDDRVCKYLADCPAGWGAIEIRHLLAVRSGIPEYFPASDSEELMGAQTTPSAMLKRIGAKPLQFAPGTQFNATNAGHYVLGLIIERVSGKSYGDFVRDNLFAPMAMTHTALDSRAIVTNRASGYSLENGRLVNARYVDPTFSFASAGAYSTAGDLVRWERALRGGKVLPQKTLAELDALIDSTGYGEPVRELAGHAVVISWGSTYGFRNHVARFPDDGVEIVILANRGHGAEPKYLRDLASIVFGKPVVKTAVEEVPLDASVARAIAGRYQFGADRFLVITFENGRLTMQTNNRPMRELVPSTNARFYLRGAEAYLTFDRDAAGRVTGLVLHEVKDAFPAKRID